MDTENFGVPEFQSNIRETMENIEKKIQKTNKSLRVRYFFSVENGKWKQWWASVMLIGGVDLGDHPESGVPTLRLQHKLLLLSTVTIKPEVKVLRISGVNNCLLNP